MFLVKLLASRNTLAYVGQARRETQLRRIRLKIDGRTGDGHQRLLHRVHIVAEICAHNADGGLIVLIAQRQQRLRVEIVDNNHIEVKLSAGQLQQSLQRRLRQKVIHGLRPDLGQGAAQPAVRQAGQVLQAAASCCMLLHCGKSTISLITFLFSLNPTQITLTVAPKVIFRRDDSLRHALQALAQAVAAVNSYLAWNVSLCLSRGLAIFTHIVLPAGQLGDQGAHHSKVTLAGVWKQDEYLGSATVATQQQQQQAERGKSESLVLLLREWIYIDNCGAAGVERVSFQLLNTTPIGDLY